MAERDYSKVYEALELIKAGREDEIQIEGEKEIGWIVQNLLEWHNQSNYLILEIMNLEHNKLRYGHQQKLVDELEQNKTSLDDDLACQQAKQLLDAIKNDIEDTYSSISEMLPEYYFAYSSMIFSISGEELGNYEDITDDEKREAILNAAKHISQSIENITLESEFQRVFELNPDITKEDIVNNAIEDPNVR